MTTRTPAPTLRLDSPGPDQTARVAAALGAAIDADGALVLLSGPLGAGKTHFVKGLAAGLGLAPERVTSPTFVVAQELALPGGGALVHVDCYRIASAAELENAGLLDWLAPGACVAVEWAERVPDAWPDDRLEIAIARKAEQGEAARTLAVRACGPRSEALLARWRARVAALA